MLCQFERVIFPRDAAASTSGFMIAMYRPCGTLRDAAGQILDRFKAVGYCLPTSDKVKYRMEGHWSKTQKHGIQFEVERYEEVITPTKDGIIAYLSSGQIRGIGKKTAEKIYETFGQETLQILDKEPRKLLTVKGISEKKLRKIIDSYLANRGARDVIAFLVPHGVSPNRAVKLYREYGEETMGLLERKVLLQNVDRHWMDHIDAMDELRNGIRLRAYAQHNPVVEYRNEGYDMFNAMSESIREDTAKMMLTVRIVRHEDLERKQVATATAENVGGDGTRSKTVVKTKAQKIGRNDPCPCGSGKKYKKCCGSED